MDALALILVGAGAYLLYEAFKGNTHPVKKAMGILKGNVPTQQKA